LFVLHSIRIKIQVMKYTIKIMIVLIIQNQILNGYLIVKILLLKIESGRMVQVPD